MKKIHFRFMNEAVKEARKGLREGGTGSHKDLIESECRTKLPKDRLKVVQCGIPIGSVLVKGGKIIGRGHNRRVQKGSAILHAEMDCLENAGRLKAGDYEKCVIYSTLSPCDMCTGAILLYKIPVIVIGENKTFKGPETYSKKRGVRLINLDLPECKKMMKDFITANPKLWNEDTGE